jgi:hypothetical protein
MQASTQIIKTAKNKHKDMAIAKFKKVRVQTKQVW